MKKKLLVLLLVLALVFSSVFTLLVACDKNDGEGDKDGYTITFKGYRGNTLFELTTTKGKITRAQVQAKEQEKRASINRERDGYIFIGWFTTVGDDGTYSGEINYAHEYKADAMYYAGYEFAPMSGEENGYTLIGVIGNVADWGDNGAGTTHDEWRLEPDANEGWIYRISGVQLLSSDNFKLKTYDVGWDDGEIDYGYGDITSLEFADGVVADLKGHSLADDLFYGNGYGNISVSRWVEYADIDVVFNYREKSFDITVNDIAVLDALPDIEWILTGQFPEPDCGNFASSTTEASLIFNPTEVAGVYTISHVFTPDLKFRIKQNLASWDVTLGYDHVNKIEGEGSIVAPAKDDLFTRGDDNNMICNYDCTLTFTIDVNKGTIDILITELADDDTVLWESAGYTMVGNFDGANWAKPRPAGDKYLFTQSEENGNIGTWSGELKANTQFKVATNILEWNGRINIGWSNGLTAYDKDGKSVAGLLEQVGDNIGVRADCNVTITLNVKNKSIKIVVNDEVEVPDIPTEPDSKIWALICSPFSSDTQTMTQGTDGHRKLTYSFTSATEFKLRVAGDWNTNVGWHNENVQVVAGSGVDSIDGLIVEAPKDGNFSVTGACTVEFDLYYVTSSNWTLVITVTSVG